MAEFNRPVDVARTDVPGYSGSSRGQRYEANESAGMIFEGLGKALTQGITAYDELIQDRIQNEAFEQAAAINEEFGAGVLADAASVAAAAPEGGPGGASLPAGANATLERLATLKAGYDAGQFNEQYYDARLLAMRRQLIQKYPGYGPQVDSAVSKATGGFTTGDAIRRMFADSGKMSQQEKDKADLIEEMKRSGMDEWPAEVMNRMEYDQLLDIYGEHNKAKFELEAQEKESAIAAKKGEVNEKETAARARFTARTTVNQGLSVILKGMNMTPEKFKELLMNPQELDATQLVALRQSLREMEMGLGFSMDSILEKQWAGTDDPSHNYRDQIKQDDLDKIREEAMRPVRLLVQAFEGDKPDNGAIAATGIWLELQKDITKRQMLESTPELSVIQPLKEMGGDFVLETWLGTSLAPTIGAMMSKFQTADILTNGGPSPMGSVRPGNEGFVPTRPNLEPSVTMSDNWEKGSELGLGNDYYKGSVNDWKITAQQIIDGQYTPDMIERHVAYAFHPTNYRMFGSLPKETAETLLTEMASPEVSRLMTKFRDSGHTEAYTMYRNWVANSFQSVFQTRINSLANYNLDRSNTMIAFDPRTSQFQFVDKPVEGPVSNLRMQGMRGVAAAEARSAAGLEIDKINKALTVIAPILKNDDQDVTTSVTQLLTTMGFSTARKAENRTLVDGVIEALEAVPKVTDEGPPQTWWDQTAPFQPEFLAPQELGSTEEGAGPVPDVGEVFQLSDLDQNRMIQVDFADQELRGVEAKAGRMLTEATTVDQAVAAGLAYLRPGVPHRRKRLLAAQEVYDGGGSDEAKLVFQRFQDRGWSKEAAAGMTGNFVIEGRNVKAGTELDPDVLGDKGTALGIGQWRKDRRENLENFVLGYAADPEIDAELEDEAEGFEPGTILEPDEALPFLNKVNTKDSSHVENLDPRMQSRLASLFMSAPPEIKDGLRIASGARSNEHQAKLYARALRKYGSAKVARKWVAPPGKSGHNSGAAVDIGWYNKGFKAIPKEAREWLHENAAQYGLKFPLSNEAWHIELAETRGGGEFKHPLLGKSDTDVALADPISLKQPVPQMPATDVDKAIKRIQRTQKSTEKEWKALKENEIRRGFNEFVGRFPGMKWEDLAEFYIWWFEDKGGKIEIENLTTSGGADA